MYWSFLEGLLPNETYYIENIKSTNFILNTYTKSMNIQIHELVTFSQDGVKYKSMILNTTFISLFCPCFQWYRHCKQVSERMIK
jgi:cell division protein YceG involved in septum cleavage